MPLPDKAEEILDALGNEINAGLIVIRDHDGKLHLHATGLRKSDLLIMLGLCDFARYALLMRVGTGTGIVTGLEEVPEGG